MADSPFDIDYEFPNDVSKELFIKEIYRDPNVFDEGLRIVPNLKADVPMDLFHDNDLSKIVKRRGGCGRTAGGAKIDIETVQIIGRRIGIDLAYCMLDLPQQFREWYFKRKTGLAEYEFDELLLAYLTEKFQNALRRDYPRMAWFSKYTASSTEYQSTEISNYDQFDGLWPNVFALAGANPDMYAGNIPDTLPTGADDVFAIFEAAHAQQSLLLQSFAETDKVYYVNGRLFDALVNAYTNKLSSGCSVADLWWRRLAEGEGQREVDYKGITVRPWRYWDIDIAADMYGYAQHRLMLVRKDTLIIGTDMEDDNFTIDIWYDKKDRLNYVESASVMGTQILYPDYLVFMMSTIISGSFTPTSRSAAQIGGAAAGRTLTVTGKNIANLKPGATAVRFIMGSTIIDAESYSVTNPTSMSIVAPTTLTTGAWEVHITNVFGGSSTNDFNIGTLTVTA